MSTFIKIAGMAVVVIACDHTLYSILLAGVGIGLVSGAAHQAGYKEG